MNSCEGVIDLMETPATARRFLFVTRKEALARELAATLSGFECQLDHVQSPETALARLVEAVPPEVLLIDEGCYNEKAAQLIAALREASKGQSPVLMISEMKSPGDLQPYQDGIVDDVLSANSTMLNWRFRIEIALRDMRLAAELAQAREAALLNAQHDPLTGVINRETMLTLLFRETDRVQRMKGSLSLLLLDIDDFSHWNALFGSEPCDSLLGQLAARLQKLLRSYDLLGRPGKDEFLLALPGCGGLSTLTFAERLRQEAFSAPFSVCGQNIRLTACIGIATSRGRSPVVVLREAEIALRRAKESGPETIQFFNDDALADEFDNDAFDNAGNF